jgi:two-component system, OmpR family, phosphate regulon sensor histidine kinase PhoR
LKNRRSINLRDNRLGKSCKIAYLIAAIEVCVLLAAAVVLWQDSYFGEGWHLAVFVGCMVGVVGVIWLAFSWYKLGREITSIASRLRTDEKSAACLGTDVKNENAILYGLVESIENRMRGHSDYVSELKLQIDELQIQLRVSQRHRINLESIIYGIHDAVVVIDQFDKLLLANESAGKLFSFDHKISRYKPLNGLLDERRQDFIEFLKKTRKSRARHTRYELEMAVNSEQRFFDCIVSCIFDENQQISGVVSILHDITKEKEIARIKNDFVSHVSHELKTPLASISAYAEMLVDGEADNDQMRKEFYSVIQSQAKRLNRLIEDILNISRIESGLIKVEKKAVSLALIIQEQMKMIQNYAEEKNIKVVCPEFIVFEQVYGDKDMLSQVVVNLLSNAIKYTPAGGTVTISTEVNEAAGMAKVSVTDTGVGIPESEIGHLFEKFHRVEANNKMAKGTGLGLSLVKQIIEKVHNGHVFVESKVGAGSTFSFELPLATADVVEGKV